MKHHRHLLTLIILCAVLLLAACANAELSPTPDPCAAENLPAEVQKVNDLTREFDDAAALAASTPRERLNSSITELQRIRRNAEDQRVPACLATLKRLQLSHMNIVIQTLMAFVGGADQSSVNQGIALSRQLHNEYLVEMARLLGMTVVAGPSPMPAEGTPTAVGESATATPFVLVITNPGPGSVNIYAIPSLDGQNLGMLEAGQSTLALGRSSDGFWIMVEIPGLPGQVAWVYAALVQLEGPIETLPIVDDLP